MSLLQHEEFAIYQLRTSYLSHIHDGVGERLINVNSAFLNDPAFKAAGWSSNPPEIKRTYSPPIPTAVTAEYFRAPPHSAVGASQSLGEDDEEGGMVTGVASNDTVGPNLVAKRRRRREQLEEDDSSDLSDESEEDTEAPRRPANQVRFEKLTSRPRSGSSPLRNASQDDEPEGPSLLVTSPSRPPEHGRLRRGSLGAVEAVKARARRDTATSSEVSSENDLDPSVFKRRQIQASTPRSGGGLAGQIKEDQQDQPGADVEDGEIDDEAELSDHSDDSSLASDFSETVAPESMMDDSASAMRSTNLPNITAGRPMTPRNVSPKKNRQPPATLPDLPPPRPISTIMPVSALAAAIKAKNKKPTSPFDRFATLSGRGEPEPLHIKIYLPPSTEVSEPLELLLRKSTNSGEPVTVGETIGFSLWRYGDEDLQPPISESRMNVNWWTLRIVEDEEVDFDFPPLGRTRPISDFTSNNNRPARGRGRDRSWDEFALVEASEAQFRENEKATPIFSQDAAESPQEPSSEKPERPMPARIPSDQESIRTTAPIRNLVINPLGMRKDGAVDTLDTPSAPVSHAVPRSGAPKTLQVHYNDVDFTPHVTPIEVTTDTYIAEVFDQICKKLNVDKALYVLKVSRTTTIAPSDRTVEALGPDRQSLDLVRRRFVGDGTFGLSGSPGSTSPNAPLLLTTTSTPKRSKKGIMSTHPLAQPPDFAAASTFNTTYKRYNVIRKQPMSFTPSHQRVIALDGEYIHIMPSDAGKERLFDAAPGKTTSVHFSSVVGCKVSRKHPKAFRVIVFKERESKRYDFEANSALEANEIVQEIKKGIEPYHDAVAL